MGVTKGGEGKESREGGGEKRRQRTFEFRELCLFDENMIIGKFDKGIFLKCVNDSSAADVCVCECVCVRVCGSATKLTR